MSSFLKKNKFISILLAFFSLSSVYIGGSFSSNTQFEKIAEHATNIVVNHTENKKYCAVTVQATGDSGPIADSNSEFHQLYGVFKQQKITFASGINADKKRDITLGESISDKLSILYVGPVGTIKYNGHYKHYSSPIEMMFEDQRNYDINRYVIYISQSHADKLLDGDSNHNRNENGQYDKSDYESLIKTNIPFFIDGNEHQVLVQNIYYQSNYYYDGLKEVMGDFVISSYYLPENLRSEQQNIYFLSEYTYQNKFFMNYINNVYSSRKFDVKLNHYNIVGNVDDSYLLTFYYSSEIYRLDWLAIFIYVISGFLLLASLALVIYQNRTINKKNAPVILTNIFVLFIPYLVFKIIYMFTNNVSYFSIDSGKITIWYIVSYILLFVIVPPILRKKLIKKVSRNEECFEIDV